MTSVARIIIPFAILFVLIFVVAWVTRRQMKLCLRILQFLTDGGIGNVISTKEIVSGMESGKARRELLFLEEKGLVERYPVPEGVEYWKITPKGRRSLKQRRFMV